MNFRFIFSFRLGFLSILLTMTSIIITVIFFALDNGVLWPIIMTWILTFFVNLYVIFVFLTFKGQWLIAHGKKGQAALWIIFGVLLLPVTHLIACYYHLFIRQILEKQGQI